MALSRIWSAFIITAVLVASYKWIFNEDQDIFSRMVVGKGDDAYDSVSYVMIGNPDKALTREKYSVYINGYGYKPDSVNRATILITDNKNADSVSILKTLNPVLKVYTYNS